MAFQQLYYTSCEHGLSGFSGYQFNAVSPDTPAETRHLVESLTAYEPPRPLLNSQTPQELARCPVNLVHVPGSPCVSAQVRYVGRDSARRVGNYFAHALSSPDFDRDGAGLLGIELWDSEVWRSTPSPSTALPELTGVRPGPLSRAAVGRFLREHPHRALLAPLLAATLDALAHRRTVLLVERDSARVAHWIAALCYLLPPPAARRLSFATYLHRPDRGRLHLVGTVPEIRIDLGPEHQDAFHLLDLVEGRAPELAVPPLARLLTRIDLSASRVFWNRAAEHLPGDEPDPGAWHGPAAATAAAAGTPLTELDIAAVVSWLRRSDDLPAPVVGTVLHDLHRQQRLSRDRLTELIRVSKAAGLPDFAQQLTGEVVEQDLLLFRDGSAQALEPVLIDDPEQRLRSTELWLTHFREAHGAAALRLLAWADGAGLEPPAHELARHGDRITERLLGTAVTATPSIGLERLLTDSARRWPAFRQGLVTAVLRLERGRPGQFREVLRTLPPGLLTEGDLIGRPDLREDFLVVEVERRRVRAGTALVDILAVRGGDEIDLALLQSLWPGSGNRWSHTEADTLLRKLPSGLRWTGGAERWLAATVLQDVPKALELAGFLKLAELLGRPPWTDRLPADARACVAYALEIESAIRQVRSADQLIALLDDRTAAGWLPVKALLLRRLPPALTDRMVHEPTVTGPLLDRLDEPTAARYLARLDERTRQVNRAAPADEPLISHLATITRAELTGDLRARVVEVLAHARDRWPTADLTRLAEAVRPVHPDWADAFDCALAKRPPTLGRRLTRLFSGGRSRTDGSHTPSNPQE
ncbi:GTPase-associated protein 1-related protein [Kitasatospora cineracea]|uniref:GTPase-associated protein 1-related protein n=1 Tax=Kitasatospora cineracea TaxID=88074 RepID=UPI0034444D64